MSPHARKGSLALSRTAVVLAAMIGGVASGPQAAAGQSVLEILAPAGGSETAFEVTCTHADGTSQTYRETTPQRFRFDGGPIACEIHATAAIEISTRSAGGNTTRTRMTGGVTRLRF